MLITYSKLICLRNLYKKYIFNKIGDSINTILYFFGYQQIKL